MPNHVRNILKFSKLKPKDREFILNNFTTEVEEDFYPLNRCFDFDKIIPEPKTEEECPEDCKVNKDSRVAKDTERPWFDWYTWRNKYWGTKWGAYNGYVRIGTSTITFVFSTAWSAPFPIYEQLHEAGYQFTVRFADEDIGSNCGIIECNPKEGEYHEILCRSVANPYRFARQVWKN